jgi:hypothetical protein
MISKPGEAESKPAETKSKPEEIKSKKNPSANRYFSTDYRRFQIKISSLPLPGRRPSRQARFPSGDQEAR